MAQATPTTASILDRARGRFLDSLSVLDPAYQVHFVPCQSGKELIHHVHNLPEVRNLRLGASGKMAGLGAFVQRLESYFKAVDIIVNVDPLHASTIWGGMRLVFAVMHPPQMTSLIGAYC